MTTLNDVMKNVDLILDNENMLEFKSFLVFTKQQNSGAEFEIRFQNLTKIQFEQIRNYIEIDKYFKSKKESVSTSNILSDNIRLETFDEPNTKGYREVYQTKRDLKSMRLNLNNIPIKINVSRENIIDGKTIKNKNKLLVRTKHRTSYIFDDFYIDLTYVNTIDNIKKNTYNSFEVEIEFKTNKNVNENNVIIPIKYILKLLKPERFSFMDESIEQSIRNEYIKSLPFITSSRPDYIFENKPINFKLEDIETFNHSITNKLNGVNFFLFFNYNKNSLYLINHSTVEYLGKDVTDKLKGNFLIQGELYHDKNSNKYIFYIFDTLIVNSEKVTDDIHKTRLDKFFPYFNIIDENLFYTNKRIGIQYKMFYGINGIDTNNPNDNFYNNLMQCLYSLSKDNNGNIDMETNDGFIFTPLDKPYINKVTYKYKFPETMTIDFSVKYKETRDNYYIFNVFTYNERKQLVPFMSNKYVMMCDNNTNANLCNQIKNDSIVECFFYKNQQVFVPYRIRYDKILPNFYKVASNVFEDIINPITLKNLEDSFRNKFLTKQILQSVGDIEPITIKTSKSPKNIKKSLSNDDISHVSTEILSLKITPPSSTEDMKHLENTLNNIELKENIKIPHTLQPKYIDIENVTLKVKLDSIFECVLFSVSPEYRNLAKNDYDKRDQMFNTALEYFNNDKNKISDINYLSSAFNIQIYILNYDENKYQMINKTINEKENKLYIIDNKNNYEVLGYSENEYDVFIF